MVPEDVSAGTTELIVDEADPITQCAMPVELRAGELSFTYHGHLAAGAIEGVISAGTHTDRPRFEGATTNETAFWRLRAAAGAHHTASRVPARPSNPQRLTQPSRSLTTTPRSSASPRLSGRPREAAERLSACLRKTSSSASCWSTTMEATLKCKWALPTESLQPPGPTLRFRRAR